MDKLVRFGVSVEKELSDKFDIFIKRKGYSNRSEAIRGLIRQELIKREWSKSIQIAGAILFVYNHHKRELLDILTDIQHEHHHLIISTQHIHLDHDNCMEIVVVKGMPKDAQKLCDKIKSVKGVKYANLNMATTGRRIP
jgi:CopG family nickel-responsive transcriptional regulator